MRTDLTKHTTGRGGLVACTCQSVRLCVSWDSLADGGLGATGGNGLDKKASQGFQLGAPSQREGIILHVRDAHTSRRTQICGRGIKERVHLFIDYVLCLLHAAPVTFQRGRLPLQWPASDGVLQSVDMHLIRGRHLRQTDKFSQKPVRLQ